MAEGRRGMDEIVAKHILVVDDNEALRYVFARSLGSAGYRISVAADGFEALRLHRADRADLVVTDYRMPGMNGAELVRRLRRIDARLPGVVMSATPGEVGTMPPGVVFFPKPVLLASLLEHLKAVL